ncbi:MAG: preprotein translocase subunit SecY [Eubacteriales bacterium]|nr:preprotein translocase subunit SecY [Eubacteriales bacterium]
MLSTLKNALKIQHIRKRLLYTLLMIVLVRIGSQLPISLVDAAAFSNMFKEMGDAFSFFDAITGGSFQRVSIFALSITPYITSSIIMQLLTIAFSRLEEMQKEGEEGRKKIQQITRVLTVGLSLLEGVAIAIGFGRQGYIHGWVPGQTGLGQKVFTVLFMALILTAGSALLMWMGERITQNGVGNGISIILLVNIISRLPHDFIGLYEKFMRGKSVPYAILAGLIILAVVLAMVVFVIFLQDGVRKIPVQHSRKMAGRRQVGGAGGSIPLKVNTAGVIPIIFAQSLLQTPVVIASFMTLSPDGWGRKIMDVLSQQNWANPQRPLLSIGLLIYVLLIIFFAYFYTSVTFNPMEIADNLKKSGSAIPGRRPGRPTVDYLNGMLGKVIFIGAVGLVIVSIIPIIFSGVFGAHVSFGGTSLIIIVGVVIETLKQIESQVVERNYKGFSLN